MWHSSRGNRLFGLSFLGYQSLSLYRYIWLLEDHWQFCLSSLFVLYTFVYDMSDARWRVTYHNDACFSLCVTTKFCSFDVNTLYLLLFDWTGYIYRTSGNLGSNGDSRSVALVFSWFIWYLSTGVRDGSLSF